MRAERAEGAAVGRAPEAEAIAALAADAVADLDDIPGDVHASPALRRSLGRVAVRRALAEAVRRAEGS